LKKNIVFILDRSGSMGGLEGDVIGGFNALLSEQQKLKQKASITTVLFDNQYEVLHDKLDLADVSPISKSEYYVRGSTALLDAIGKTINTLKSSIKKKDTVLCFINTDGEENASVEYTNKAIKELVEECEKERWTFVFIGAGIERFATADSIGLVNSNSFTTTRNSAGIHSVYSSVSNAVSSYLENNEVDLETLGDIK